MTSRMIRETRILNRSHPVIDQWRTVALGGGDFRTIQQAIDYAHARSSSEKKWGIRIYPGQYAENLTMRSNVYLFGAGRDVVNIVGSISAEPDVLTGLFGCGVTFICTGDDSTAVQSGTGTIQNCRVLVVITSDCSLVGIDLNGIGSAMNLIDTGVVFASQRAGITKNQTGILYSGSAITAMAIFAVRGSIDMASGRFCGILNQGSGECVPNSGGVFIENLAAVSDANCYGSCFAGTGTPNIFTDFQVRLRGNGGGRAVAFYHDGEADTQVSYNNASVFFEGIWDSEDVADRRVADSLQIIRIVSLNKAVGPAVESDILVTPWNDKKTGFVAFGGSGNAYSVAGNVLSLLRYGIGYIRSVPLHFENGQTVEFVANERNTILIDENGILTRTEAADEESYLQNMPLWQVLYDGTNVVVKRENHPYSYNTTISRWAHRTQGTVIGQSGGNVARVATGTGGAVGDRQIYVTEAGTIDDHGIDGLIPATTIANPITMQVWYKNASGFWQRHSASTQVPMLYLLASVPTAISSNSYGILRVEVILDDGNTPTPTYVVRLANQEFGNQNDAQAAINAERLQRGTYFVLPDGAYENMEPANWLYMVIRNTVAGGHIVSITRIRQAE